MIANQQESDSKKNWGIQLLLVLTAAVLFALSFPNLIFKNGLSFLAWVAYIPVLVLISKNSFLSCAALGAVYGVLAYGLFNYWLGSFHPLAGTIVYCIYLFYMAVVFTLLKLASVLFPKKAYIVQWLIWLAYEYLRTKGFAGYTYGITGYSQWRVIPLIQIAGITGVWGVSALVTFPSFWLAEALKDFSKSEGIKGIGNATASFFRKEKISAVVWTLTLAVSVIFGIAGNKDFSSFPQANIALIQHNTDPWSESGNQIEIQVLEAYRKDLGVLKRLSDEAIASAPETQLVVWPETAFVPRIYWYMKYRDNQNFWQIVKELLDYLSAKNVPFLIGNDDARMEPEKNPNPEKKFRVDYNAAILFEKGQITDVYRKLHLVPFTEYFPYKKQLPAVYRALEKANTHFWEKGETATVFAGPGFTFSAPICFEDTFGYLSRNFVRRGADILINLSNDAWSKSLPAQNQHLSTAVFRAVENRRPMLRSTVSGQTCAIDPSGRITAMASPFTAAWISAKAPIIKENTLYTLYGDYLAIIFTLAAAILLISGVLWSTIKR
ncbi:MAG: apolipoprotein N-acyltransferase [Treponema sp.]|jgi:apolipoprotein N-acyltransferase|nr:apolipoprotein N-acyltransferase [Treponema sp.]